MSLIPPHRAAAAPAIDAPPLELTDGEVEIGGVPILRDIDLTVLDGEFVALMGANGSGKSTLVRALTGLRPLAGGRLRLFGTAYDDFKDWRRIGYVPQRVGAASGVPASVWEIVASGRLTHRKLLRPLSRADREIIDDAIEVVGLSGKARDGAATLSGGQQQRTLIARALAGQPDLLFMDEPTAGVDLPNQEALADTLERLKARGATIVLVAHELGPLERLIDRSVVLRDGRKVYDGPCLSDADVHASHFGWLVSHHHDHDHAPDRAQATHSPHASAPLDCTHEEAQP